MPRRITVNVGFITNSSSCVYYFPKEVLSDPMVKAFLKAYELEDGYLGSNLQCRDTCASLIVTKAQKGKAKAELTYEGESTEASQAIDPDSDGVYVFYGDEYTDTTQILCRIMSEALARLTGVKDPYHLGYVTDHL